MADLIFTRDDYFEKDTPIKTDQIANYIEVQTQPYKPAAATSQVYKTSIAIPINIGEYKTTFCNYSETPVLPYAVSPYAGSSALAYWTNEQGEKDDDETQLIVTTNTKYYAHGASVEVYNDFGANCYFVIEITGHKFAVQGEETYVVQDNTSINDNGTYKFTFKKDRLVQNYDVAKIIGDRLLASHKDPRKDTTLQCRGNPALELNDTITVPEYGTATADFIVLKQVFSYDGTLRCTIEGRRVPT